MTRNKQWTNFVINIFKYDIQNINKQHIFDSAFTAWDVTYASTNNTEATNLRRSAWTLDLFSALCWLDTRTCRSLSAAASSLSASTRPFRLSVVTGISDRWCRSRCLQLKCVSHVFGSRKPAINKEGDYFSEDRHHTLLVRNNIVIRPQYHTCRIVR